MIFLAYSLCIVVGDLLSEDFHNFMAYSKPRNPDGRPADYGETKTRVNMSLTPTCIDILDQRANELGCSRSEIVERFSRSPACLAVLQELMMGAQGPRAKKQRVSNTVGQLELIS